MMEIKGT